MDKKEFEPEQGEEKKIAQTKVLGVKINPVSYQETIATIKTYLKGNIKHQITTVNPEFIVTAQSDPEFKQILNDASLAVPDGVGLLLVNRDITTRVTGTDLIERLAEVGEKEGWRFFFLGGRNSSGQETSNLLRLKYPALKVVGNFEGDGSEVGDKESVDKLREAGPIDLLLVAYGHPKQEKWIKRNLEKSNAKVAIGVGGAFDYLSGRSARAPGLVRQIGLEWLFRLIKEPWRFKRQLALPKFIYLVLKEKLIR
jgi:N-acetylglucosaminyldiphosphoundecaprenol N-acetyl-beta-D-mannosaminyltransferase